MTDRNDTQDPTPAQGIPDLTQLAREIAEERAARGHSDVDGAALPPEQRDVADPVPGSRGYTTDEPADPNTGAGSPDAREGVDNEGTDPERAAELREDPNGVRRSGAAPLRPPGSDLSAP